LPGLPIACSACREDLQKTDSTWQHAIAIDVTAKKLLGVELLYRNKVHLALPSETLRMVLLGLGKPINSCAHPILSFIPPPPHDSRAMNSAHPPIDEKLSVDDPSLVIRCTVFGTIRCHRYLHCSLAELGIPEGSTITHAEADEDDEEEAEMEDEDYLTPGLPVSCSFFSGKKIRGEVVQDLSLLAQCDKFPAAGGGFRRVFMKWANYPGCDVETLLLREDMIRNETPNGRAEVRSYCAVGWSPVQFFEPTDFNIDGENGFIMQGSSMRITF